MIQAFCLKKGETDIRPASHPPIWFVTQKERGFVPCAGDFYASQGPAFSECYVEDDHLHIECTPCEEIHIITYPPRGKAVYALDKPLTELDYPLKGAETYVRVECIDHEGRTAWSNPIWM